MKFLIALIALCCTSSSTASHAGWTSPSQYVPALSRPLEYPPQPIPVARGCKNDLNLCRDNINCGRTSSSQTNKYPSSSSISRDYPQTSYAQPQEQFSRAQKHHPYINSVRRRKNQSRRREPTPVPISDTVGWNFDRDSRNNHGSGCIGWECLLLGFGFPSTKVRHLLEGQDSLEESVSGLEF